MVVAEELLLEEPLPADVVPSVEDLTPGPHLGVPAGLSEPTLQDLVAKLQTEPWANPKAFLRCRTPISRTVSRIRSRVTKPAEGVDPSESLLDRHETKFPLGGVSPTPEADPATPVENEKVAPEEPPQPAKIQHSERNRCLERLVRAG